MRIWTTLALLAALLTGSAAYATDCTTTCGSGDGCGAGANCSGSKCVTHCQ